MFVTRRRLFSFACLKYAAGAALKSAAMALAPGSDPKKTLLWLWIRHKSCVSRLLWLHNLYKIICVVHPDPKQDPHESGTFGWIRIWILKYFSGVANSQCSLSKLVITYRLSCKILIPLHHSTTTPLHHHSTTPPLHHHSTTTPPQHHHTTPPLHHSTTPPPHKSTTTQLHHNTTPPPHHSTTPPLHHSTIINKMLFCSSQSLYST